MTDGGSPRDGTIVDALQDARPAEPDWGRKIPLIAKWAIYAAGAEAAAAARKRRCAEKRAAQKSQGWLL